jgi:LmbE family N-acetylglucosaminyl deacetylase
MFIISPHIDDAIFSIGNTINSHFKGKTVVIINVFSISNFTISKTKTSIESVTNLRKAEELDLLNKLAFIQTINLDFLDAPLRNISPISNNRKLDAHSQELIDDLYKRLVSIIPKSETVFFPLSIGNHIDHIICFELALKLMLTGRPYFKLKFYEDMPYKAKIQYLVKDDRISEIEYRTGFAIKVFLQCQPNPIKSDLIACYKSQLNSEIVSAILNFDELNGETTYAIEVIDKK